MFSQCLHFCFVVSYMCKVCGPIVATLNFANDIGRKNDNLHNLQLFQLVGNCDGSQRLSFQVSSSDLSCTSYRTSK
jgi:hypothetical protein